MYNNSYYIILQTNRLVLHDHEVGCIQLCPTLDTKLYLTHITLPNTPIFYIHLTISPSLVYNYASITCLTPTLDNKLYLTHFTLPNTPIFYIHLTIYPSLVYNYTSIPYLTLTLHTSLFLTLPSSHPPSSTSISLSLVLLIQLILILHFILHTFHCLFSFALFFTFHKLFNFPLTHYSYIILLHSPLYLYTIHPPHNSLSFSSHPTAYKFHTPFHTTTYS